MVLSSNSIPRKNNITISPTSSSLYDRFFTLHHGWYHAVDQITRASWEEHVELKTEKYADAVVFLVQPSRMTRNDNSYSWCITS